MIHIHPLRLGDEKLVAQRLKEILEPASDHALPRRLTGWEVSVQELFRKSPTLRRIEPAAFRQGQEVITKLPLRHTS